MNFILSDKAYQICKSLAMIVLPAAGTLYAALAGLWHLPYPVEIVGTIAAVDTFLGAVLGISTNNYNKLNPPIQ